MEWKRIYESYPEVWTSSRTFPCFRISFISKGYCYLAYHTEYDMHEIPLPEDADEKTAMLMAERYAKNLCML